MIMSHDRMKYDTLRNMFISLQRDWFFSVNIYGFLENLNHLKKVTKKISCSKMMQNLTALEI